MSDISLNCIVAAGMRAGASDIHISAGCEPVLRIDGQLMRLEDVRPLDKDDVTRIVEELLTKVHIKDFGCRHDIDIGLGTEVCGERCRLRAAIFHERDCPAIALRIVNPAVRTIRELGLPDVLYSAAQERDGLFIVTGPAGSGKSSTLAAMVDEINRKRRVHIITIEDPIEYIHKSDKALIRQREIGRDASDFAEAVRSALRQDPDVIVIGEMRDPETTAAAMTAAETGHLVLATMHTRGAAESVNRVIDLFPAEDGHRICAQLASVLKGVLSQQLVPRIGGGRVAAAEYLAATASVRNKIRTGQIAQVINDMQTGSRYGMMTIDNDLARLLKNGIITEKTKREYSHNNDDQQ